MQAGTVSRLRFLQEILKNQNQHQEEHYAFFGSHTFVTISWICKKQTSVSHSPTEAEIISLDAGLLIDGIPALDLWDLVKEVFHSLQNPLGKTKGLSVQGTCCITPHQTRNQAKGPTKHDNLDLCNVYSVPFEREFFSIRCCIVRF